MTHMSPEEFRHDGYRVVDWIVDYWTQLESFPVAPKVEPGDILRRLPAHPPEQGESFDAVLRDLDELLVPGLLHWQHPRFFGYFPANSSGPAVLADLLCAGLGVQGMLWVTSPACTELEQRVLDWLAEALGLPERFRFAGPGGGVIQDSASSSVILAVLAAMHQASAGRVRREGVATYRYVLYATAETHSSVTKAALVTGLGEQAIRQVATRPGDMVMEAAHLRELITMDLAAGNTPLLTVATVGTTSTCAVDPVPDIGALCREHGIWLHVDAAYAGVAAVCPELRWLNDGVAEFADSYCTNPHKWLLTNFDCDTFWVADRAALTGALSVLPEFLRNRASDSGRVTDYRDWQIPLGRRFRALKLWAVMRWYGMTGLRAHIERGIGHAQQLTRWITDDNRFELTAPQRLSLVCFRLRVGCGVTAVNQANLDLLARVNATGITFLTHTKIDELISLRFATGGTHTELHHVEQAWHCVQKEAADLLFG
ncbi:MAG: pyridoxal-dependent decarboxylase [Pseudonocardiaceae bacterium]